MPSDPRSFFEAIISAGAIMSGFCGTFLAFRIQREANYYRQPALSYDRGDAKDILIKLTHFTSPFLLLILASLCSMAFGFLIPLLALAGSVWALAQTKLVVAGLVATLILLIAYFFDELVHYRILSPQLLNDAREWREELVIVLVALTVALITSFAVYARL
jgi:hypothetical protein